MQILPAEEEQRRPPTLRSATHTATCGKAAATQFIAGKAADLTIRGLRYPYAARCRCHSEQSPVPDGTGQSEESRHFSGQIRGCFVSLSMTSHNGNVNGASWAGAPAASTHLCQKAPGVGRETAGGGIFGQQLFQRGQVFRAVDVGARFEH